MVPAEDEERVDDLVAFVPLPGQERSAALGAAAEKLEGGDAEHSPAAGRAIADPSAMADVVLLADAAGRLHRDPTDMLADSDVAEASTSVFMSDHFDSIGSDTWAAVGRVTRRLLAYLGADEALEDEIRTEAGILARLLEPIVGASSATPDEPPPDEPPPVELEPDEPPPVELEPEEPPPVELEPDDQEPADQEPAGIDETVYELAEWLPEQRAHLGLLLEGEGISYEWEGDELVVPAGVDAEVEALFEKVGGVDTDDEDDETRYQAVAELFAACGRLAADPGDEQRAASVVEWARASEGPPLLGMDEVDWFRIMSRLRSLLESIDAQEDLGAIRDEASMLHDLLRSVV